MGSLTTNDHLSWTESSPGVWTRDLDATEAHFTGMGSTAKAYGREFGLLSVVLKVDFNGADLVTASRLAWLSARYQYPLLASSIESLKRVYHIGSDEELKFWLEETFIVHTTEEPYQNADQVRKVLRPVKRAQLHVLPHSDEMIVHIGHDVLDGHAMLYLVNKLLQELSVPSPDVTFGTEAANLPIPLCLAANIPPVTDSQEAQVKKSLNDWFAALPWLSVKAVNTDKPPGDTTAQRQKLSDFETKAVIAGAKAKGFTPTHVVEAAAILALAELDQESHNKSYGSCGIFSMRQQCKEPWRQAVIPYLHIYPMVIKPTSFVDTASQLKTYYEGQRANMQNLLALVQPTFCAFANMASTPPPPGSNQMVSLSSLGRFEPVLQSTHGNVKLEDLWLMYETPNAVVNSFLWTRENSLSWQVVYNEVYYEETTIAKWISSTKRLLFEGLGILES